MKRKKGRQPNFSEDYKMESFFGIESAEIVYNNRYNDDYFRYEPTSYRGLICAFDEICDAITCHDRLVDFGCGKGRVLFYVNQRFRCEVCGIEVDEDLYEVAIQNRADYNKRFKDCAERIEILNGKAEEYIVQREDTIFYFFNPFEINIFEQVMEHILENVKKYPRRILVMMYYAKEEYRNYMRTQGFCLYRIVKLPEYDTDYNEKVIIYEYGEAPGREESSNREI